MNINNNNDDPKFENFNEAVELEPSETDENFDDLEDDNRLPLKKRNHRVLLFHVLYTADTYDFETPVEEIVQSFNREYETDIELDSDIISTVKKIGAARTELDKQFIPFLKNWKYDRIGYCTILILRYAIWELLHTDMHHNIVINEAIELAKSFAEKDAFKFVNGILDKISKKITLEKAAAEEARINNPVDEEESETQEEMISEKPQLKRAPGSLTADEIMDAALASIEDEESSED